MTTLSTQPPFFIKWYMKLLKYDGLTTYWDTIYFKDREALQNNRIMRHELCHIEQMKRDGKLKHFFTYNYYWIKYGYKNNPYEVEARKAEGIFRTR